MIHVVLWLKDDENSKNDTRLGGRNALYIHMKET